MFIYDKTENKVVIRYKRTRRGKPAETKKWEGEPVYLIPNIGRYTNPYFTVLKTDFPAWVNEYLDFELRNYSTDYYSDENVVILREDLDSSKALFYRQYIEQFILNLFSTLFVSNDLIDYSPFRDKLLSHVEVVGWNLFNNAEKLKTQHNVSVVYEINNPHLMGVAKFDFIRSTDVPIEEKVASLVETLIDESDYLASGENEAQYVQSLLINTDCDESIENVEELDIKECSDDSTEVFKDIDDESNAEEVPVKVVKPVEEVIKPFVIEVQIEEEANSTDEVIEPISEELEPVAIDVVVEPISEELEPVAIDVVVEPISEELEPVAIDVSVTAASEELIKNDEGFDLLMLNANFCVSPKKGRKTKGSINLGQSTLF